MTLSVQKLKMQLNFLLKILKKTFAESGRLAEEVTDCGPVVDLKVSYQ